MATAYGESNRTRVNAVQIVQVRREAEPLDGPLDVLLDVAGFVGHLWQRLFAVRPEDVEAAFGRNWCCQREAAIHKQTDCLRKILSRQLCLRMKSPSSFSFTPAWYTTAVSLTDEISIVRTAG
jgi:hypothetical protein